MDYTKLSDFEINKLVAKHWLPCDYYFNENENRVDLVALQDVMNNGIHDQVFKPYAEYNPCNNPSDAWPIIVENKISIFPCGLREKKWQAEFYYLDAVKHENPLRAAMIVYLMMNEDN